MMFRAGSGLVAVTASKDPFSQKPKQPFCPLFAARSETLNPQPETLDP